MTYPVLAPMSPPRLRPHFRVLLLPFAAMACGTSAGQGDPDAPRAGLWEVTFGITDEALQRLPERSRAEILSVGTSRTGHRCLRRVTPAVGDPFRGGLCTYSRVADHEAVVERVATCPAPGRGLIDTVDISGTRSASHYDFRIVTRRDPASRFMVHRVETYERGRRIGDCPDDARSSQ